MIITLSLSLAIGLLFLCAFLTIVRVLRGPTDFDQVLALDALGIVTAMLWLVLQLFWRNPSSIDIILLCCILSFFSTIVFAFFLSKTSPENANTSEEVL